MSSIDGSIAERGAALVATINARSCTEHGIAADRVPSVAQCAWLVEFCAAIKLVIGTTLEATLATASCGADRIANGSCCTVEQIVTNAVWFECARKIRTTSVIIAMSKKKKTVLRSTCNKSFIFPSH
jgi:hypothetical protein